MAGPLSSLRNLVLRPRAVREFFSAADRFPRTEGIEAAEEAWRGGVADLGDKSAGWAVQQMPGYFDYRSALEEALLSRFGGRLPLYRMMPASQYEEWVAGANMGPVATSFSPRVAKAMAKTPSYRDDPRGGLGLYRINADTNYTPVMVGKPEELELVIDGDYIQPDDIEFLRPIVTRGKR